MSQLHDLEQAAAHDGAEPLRILWGVIVPLARASLAAAAVLIALVRFDDNELMRIQRGLTAFSSAETPQQQVLLTATVIPIVPVAVFYLLAQGHIVNGTGAAR